VPKGYIVLTEDVKDPAGMGEYAKLAGKAMAGATLLSFDRSPQVLEGEWHGSQTVLLEFESVEAARAWYESEDYQRRSSCDRPLPIATVPSFPVSADRAVLVGHQPAGRLGGRGVHE
jgi:uncharacterized protein (DUF1330 family)